MKQVLIRQGQAIVEEVPAPQIEDGMVLVQVAYSCISIGTEMSGIKMSGAPLWKRALRQPEKMKKVIEMALTQGIKNTYQFVENKISMGTPIGYSAAGVVVEVGNENGEFSRGDQVACAGAQCAHHAEFISVPLNLTVPVPHQLDLREASTVTLGAIALQGLRRAQPTLGETFVVIGLGLLGQLTVQLLKANGCRVIGADTDIRRVRLAQELGSDVGIYPENGREIETVIRITDGIGADGIIITAATSSDEVMSMAFQMCRKKGRVVLVGDVGLHLNRADFYTKELDFFISTSYGPGRYDRRYEEEGMDYPVGYVRWTENRNMREYLRLVAEGKIKLTSLIEAAYPLEQAREAYEKLQDPGRKPIAALFVYPSKPDTPVIKIIANRKPLATRKDQIRIAVVGAGGFAKGMHLPNLQKLSNLYHIRAIVSRTGHNALSTARQFGADYATTEYHKVLEDTEIDAVLLTTRHNLHAPMVLEALKAAKHVIVEKPLALTEDQLCGIEEFYRMTSDKAPILMTVFNRRFSPFARRMRDIVAKRNSPMILVYQMNAGYIPLDHWTQTKEGGGRNIGEACHIYDLFTYLTDSHVRDMSVRFITPATGYYSHRDNFIATITFQDGSVATLVYTALGTSEYPKERMEIFVDGKVLCLDNYLKLIVTGARVKGITSKTIDKGHGQILEAFAAAVHGTPTPFQHEGKESFGSSDWPIPLWQQLQATQISFAIEKLLDNSRPL